MTVSSLQTTEKAKQQQLKVSIYCDFQNVHLNSELSTELLELAESKGRLITKKIYYNSLVDNLSGIKSSYENIGYQMLDVTCSLKNSVDNQLKSDVIDDICQNNAPDVVILVSGDGDFANLVKVVRDKSKYVIIFARKGNLKKSLKDVANEFHFIDELPQLVGKKTQPQTTVINPQISYNEALGCLIETVKQTISQGKPTNYSYIDRLMRQLYPKYQGISSISTPSGKKFKNFTKFVDAAVNSGKIQRQNQELFLIELNELAA
ncbi:MAG: NYN domain-containing protein [Dolichospermum sp.]|nr:NYN domain-containing protein [Dolichospermum sp.]